MCGIAGIITQNEAADQQQLRKMCSRLMLRGPDGGGCFYHRNIALGHRRLSIIDLQTGDQPMHSVDGSVVVVFNGEIYNFAQLRHELLAKGLRFRTNSDTEVLINGYLAYGIDEILHRMEGMFAFALYDKKNEKLFIARDKFGEKPLYYSENSDAFWFASELKAFPPEVPGSVIDPVGLNYFFALTYIPAPYTIYKSVKKLEAGHYLAFENGGMSKPIPYFDLAVFAGNLPPVNDFEEAKKLVRDLLSRSVADRMISDVPLGAFLSGGIDSSIVVALMAKTAKSPINTFTIGFREKSYDESQRAALMAAKAGANHMVQYLDYKDVVDCVDEIILHYDEPFGDSSAIPSFFVAKLAAEQVKVVLTGDCADELFGGYEKYLASYYAAKFNRLPKPVKTIATKIIYNLPHNRLTNVFLRKAKKVINNADLSNFDLHYSMMALGFSDIERRSLLKNHWHFDVKPEIEKIYNAAPGTHPLEKSQFTDMKLVLEGDMFVKIDRGCMKNSLESRAPFMDTRIVETVFRIPPEFKIKGKNKKFILKEAFRDLLPNQTIGFRKKGFGVPIDYWLKNELRQELERLLSKDLIEKQGLFSYPYIEQLLLEHRTGRENHKSKLWNLYVFQKWYQNRFMKQ
ncbi:MAG TPA: asparagine synthase (glutamine-hydrolyzing) [Bacteroidales bacterium]|nr:asparagine synthase (glutamine-hydrolyzing) [Bacteroidales bacterium]